LKYSVGAAPLGADRNDLGKLRAVLASGVAVLGLIAGLPSPADAASRRGYFDGYFAAPQAYDYYAPRRARSFAAPARGEQKAEPKKEVSFGEMPKGPMQIVVSINSQKVTLFSNGQRVAQGPVSTGVPGHLTPMGVFSVIEKDRYHHSNIYSGAPMPFMQRITWSGVALHEGVVTGHPASHGCIRLTHDFAQKLWPITKLGVRVIVTHDELTPRDFEHAKLFGPKQKPPAAEAALQNGLVRLAQATETNAAVVDSDAPRTPVERRVGEGAITVAPAREQAPGEQHAADAPSSEIADPSAATGTVPAPIDQLRKAVDAPQQGAGTGVAETTPSAQPAVPPPAASQPAARGAVEDGAKPAPTVDPSRPVAPVRTRSADPQPVKRGGQVAVFVSRKEGKIFVRQGFIPLLEMPIKIADPQQPLGTHVFTAMSFAEQGNGMRWNLISVPSDTSPVVERKSFGRRSGREPAPPVQSNVPLKAPSSAAEALDRIEFPQEAIERIAELLIPGSSLVVSDEGLGKETGRYTEFIVLTR
jgi:hypothetical protein